MRTVCWLVISWMVTAGPIVADWKITKVTTSGGARPSSITDYYKNEGKLHRSDYESNVQVVDLANLRLTQWLPSRKECKVTALKMAAKVEANQWQMNGPAQPTYLSEITTTDTGDRQDDVRAGGATSDYR